MYGWANCGALALGDGPDVLGGKDAAAPAAGEAASAMGTSAGSGTPKAAPTAAHAGMVTGGQGKCDGNCTRWSGAGESRLTERNVARLMPKKRSASQSGGKWANWAATSGGNTV